MYAYKGNACSLNKIWNIHKIKKKIIVPAKSKKVYFDGCPSRPLFEHAYINITKLRV